MKYLRLFFKRLIMLVAVIWAAGTLNFLLPQLTPRNPIAEKLTQLAATSGVDPAEVQALTESFSKKFGLDRPLWEKYVDYLRDVVTFDFGQSITAYPAKVSDLIGNALPWTIGLMATTTVISFLLGTLIGAAAAWKRDSVALQALSSLLMVFSAIPFYLIGLVLIYFFAADLGWFPLSGGYSLFSIPGWNLPFILEVLNHAILPALSITIASVGIWAIGMRGMMVTVQGEDYMTFAEAKGLKARRRFSALRRKERHPAPGDDAGAVLRADRHRRGARGDRLRISGRRHLASRFHHALRLPHDLRHRLHPDPCDRHGDAARRPDLSADRSARAGRGMRTAHD